MRDAAPDARTIALTQGDLLWAAGSLCNLHRLPFSAALLQRECPPPCSATQLIAALADLGLRARVVEVARGRVPAALLPAIVFLHSSADTASAADPTQPEAAPQRDAAPRLALLVRIESARVLLFHAGSNEPTVMSAADFDAVASGRLLAVEADAARGGGDDDDVLSRRRGFGFRWFADELLRHRRAVRDVLAASLAVQLIALATPLCSQIIIDKVIAHQVESTLAVIAVALGSLIVFSSLLGWIRQFLVAHVGNAVDAALGSAVFRHLIRLPLPFFERRPTGVLAARLQGIETIREFLSGATVTLLLELPFIGLFLGFMLVYSVPLSAVTLALMVLIVVISALAAPLFQVRLDEQFLRGARNQAFVTEHVAGIETVKSLQMESTLERRYDAQLRAYLDASFATRCLANTYHTLAGALEQLQGAAVLCLGAMLVMRGPDFTIGMLVAFQMFAARVTQPMLRLVGLWQQFQMATIAVRRLADIMDVPPEPRTLVAAAEATGPARVEFRGVGFRYAAARPRVLQGFDLDVAAGECVAIIGASGAGKSTLAKLLQGFVHPTEGEVRLDGRDTRSLAANELRTALGVVPQETVLFSGNVHDNLVVAHPHASHEGVVQACRLA